MPSDEGNRSRAPSKHPGPSSALDVTLLEYVGLVESDVKRIRDQLSRPRALAESLAVKRNALRRLLRMHLAALDLCEETGAPYRDARMLLTILVLGHAAAVRAKKAALEQPLSEAVALAMMQAYPSLASKFADRGRRERIRNAIASAASSARRVPWKAIAAVWNGIEKQEVDAGIWRVRWYEWTREHGKPKGAQLPWDKVVDEATRLTEPYGTHVRTGGALMDDSRAHERQGVRAPRHGSRPKKDRRRGLRSPSHR